MADKNPLDRYFLDRDNSGHWYVVPCDKAPEWHAWVEMDENDEASWDVPEFAQPVGGSHTLVSFMSPDIG
jgi:hypothetical protein